MYSNNTAYYRLYRYKLELHANNHNGSITENIYAIMVNYCMKCIIFPMI